MKLKPYSKMKDSGIEWIGEIPKDWDVKRLKFSVFLRSDKSRDSSFRPYVGLENIEPQTGKLIDVNNEMEESDAKLFEENDVLLGKLRPYLAKVWLAKFAGKCSSEFLVFKGIDYDSKFLSLLLLSDGSIKIIDSSTYGTKMPRAEWNFIGNMVFPVPVPDEQKQITNFLDRESTKIDLEISENQKLIELLKEKRQSMINHAVTKGLDPKVPMKDSGIDWIGKIPEDWKIFPSKHIIILKHGHQFRSVDYVECGIPVIRIEQLKSNGSIDLSESQFVDIEWEKRYRDFLLKKDDILMALTGGTVGKTARITNEIGKALQNYRVGKFFPKKTEKVFANYIYYILISQYTYEQILININQSSQPNIGQEYFDQIVFVLPPIEEQKIIFDYLEKQISKIDFLIKNIELQITKLQEFYQSLISSAVTGKIDLSNIT